jgi:hypothetical protein
MRNNFNAEALRARARTLAGEAAQSALSPLMRDSRRVWVGIVTSQLADETGANVVDIFGDAENDTVWTRDERAAVKRVVRQEVAAAWRPLAAAMKQARDDFWGRSQEAAPAPPPAQPYRVTHEATTFMGSARPIYDEFTSREVALRHFAFVGATLRENQDGDVFLRDGKRIATGRVAR